MFGLAEIVLLLLVAFPIFILFIAALVDILKNRFPENDKLVWLLVVIFLPFLGPILYFTIGAKQKIKD